MRRRAARSENPATMSSRSQATVAIRMSGKVVSSVKVSLTTFCRAVTAKPQMMNTTCAQVAVTTQRPPKACQRASRSVPMPFSSGGSLAISATRMMTPYPASRPVTSPMSVRMAPGVCMKSVSRHHRYMVPSRPSPMTASTTIGKTIRALPVPGEIGLAVRIGPVARGTPAVGLRAPVVLMAPATVLASAVACAPVARIAPVVLPRAPVVRRPPVALVRSGNGLALVALTGPRAPVGAPCGAAVSQGGSCPVCRWAGEGRPCGVLGWSCGSLDCAPVGRTRQDCVQRRPTAGSAHSGGGS